MKRYLWGVSLCIVLNSCSTNKLQQTPESRKFNFEQAFAEQCIKKEIRNSINKDIDRLRFTKPCSCIAKRISNNLSKREMDKFLLEQKITHSITMSFDKAAYFCVQNVSRPKPKFLYGRKQ
jgi:hypothetical protein